jgi:ABC-type sugar transport system ATPase subunit
MVFQNYAVLPHLTVFENIAFGLRMAKLPQAEVRVVEPLGPHVLVTTTVAGQPFRAILDSAHLPQPGDMLCLAPIPDRVRWFDPATQAAL